MVSNHKIASAALCRKCLAECMQTNLEREDCQYFLRQEVCRKCHQVRHIVVGVRLSKRLTANKDW